MVVPHTFGGDLKFNCRLHVLISTGLDDATGRWIPKVHLNKNTVMKMWRLPRLDLLSTAYYSEKHLHWIILWDDIVSTAHFLRYAARYVHRPPIAMWRILRLTEGKVQFVAKDTRNKKGFRHCRRLISSCVSWPRTYPTIIATRFAISAS